MGDTQAVDSRPTSSIPVNAVETVVIRFAGDSGDGMQLTGTRFSTESALFGNDIRTLPDFPAEIRAPAGTLAGVSAFQLSFSNSVIDTPGDALDVLVAMNPAALRMNLADLKAGGNLIINTSQFTKKNFEKAGIETDPREDGSLEKYRLHAIDITDLTNKALDDLGMKQKQIDRCKNFFALGLSFWLYGRTIDNTVNWLSQKFKGKDQLIEANTRALKAGYYYGETTEAFDVRYEVKPADIEPGFYRSISGNQALALGFISASQKSGMELFLGSYPITPASDILHTLSGYKHYGVHTFQAEDEIAAVTSAIGASFGGALALTTTSGPGLALK
ncbi:MAG: 2-oxoacid:acceptor oxidoreductase family protein, partial [Myxococcota bacterium]|nr:2-oxoacid:acceptor oxidoreductase family protein [Myxococcota bacterium]